MTIASYYRLTETDNYLLIQLTFIELLLNYSVPGPVLGSQATERSPQSGEIKHILIFSETFLELKSYSTQIK